MCRTIKRRFSTHEESEKAQEIADRRLQLISPLLGLLDDPAKARQVRAQLCEQSGLSDRTLRRYLASYRSTAMRTQAAGRNHIRAEEAVPCSYFRAGNYFTA